MFRLVRFVLPCGRLSSLDSLELSQHLWTAAAKNVEGRARDCDQDGTAAECRDSGRILGEGVLFKAAGSSIADLGLIHTRRFNARIFSNTIGGNYVGERNFNSTAAAGIRSRGNDEASTSGARQAGTRNRDENEGMEFDNSGSEQPVKKSKFGVQATDAGPAGIVRSIVKEHGPLTNHEVWTFAQDAGIRSRSHMKAMLKWLQERNQVELICVTPPDKQTPIKPEGEFFFRMPKKGQLKADIKDEVLRKVVERRKAASSS